MCFDLEIVQMVVSNSSAVIAPPVRKSISELAQDFVSQGCPPAQAWELAGKQYDTQAKLIVDFHEQQAKQNSRGTTPDGIPCDMVRTSRGTLVPVVSECCAILVEGSSNKQGTGFGPKLRTYLKQYATSVGASPAPIDLTAGSSSSICDPDQTSAWQFAEMLAIKTDCKLFIREVVIGKDKSESYVAKEYTDRQEWLTIVRDEITLFFDEVAEARMKTTGKRK